VTRPYAEVIGDPISHSKSPLIHNFWLEKLGIEADYRPHRVRPEELRDYFARRRDDPDWRGCNITLPHKVASIAMVDEIDSTARNVGAINTVVHTGGLRGFNTDVAGFLEPLAGRTFGVVTLIGAGGAARAVLAALPALGTYWVSLQNRSISKGQALLEEFGLNGAAVPIGSEVPIAQLLVNSSSLGMTGQPELPHVLSYVSDKGTVYDIVYSPLETKLLARARERGLVAIDGLTMLIGQAAAAFEKFFGEPAPREHDAELRALLTR
jgi:shikimate dehydrogenase